MTNTPFDLLMGSSKFSLPDVQKPNGPQTALQSFISDISIGKPLPGATGPQQPTPAGNFNLPPATPSPQQNNPLKEFLLPYSGGSANQQQLPGMDKNFELPTGMPSSNWNIPNVPPIHFLQSNYDYVNDVARQANGGIPLPPSQQVAPPAFTQQPGGLQPPPNPVGALTPPADIPKRDYTPSVSPSINQIPEYEGGVVTYPNGETSNTSEDTKPNIKKNDPPPPPKPVTAPPKKAAPPPPKKPAPPPPKPEPPKKEVAYFKRGYTPGNEAIDEVYRIYFKDGTYDVYGGPNGIGGLKTGVRQATDLLKKELGEDWQQYEGSKGEQLYNQSLKPTYDKINFK